MLYWVAAVLLAALGWCLYTRFSRAGRLIAKIPGPKGIPFIGNAFKVMRPLDKLFIYSRELYKTFGGITSFYLCNMRYVNIYEPDDVETILSTNRHNDKQLPYTFLRPWLSEGLLVSNGKKWQHRRKMLTPAFHFNILKKYTSIFTEQTEEFLRRVQKEVDKEKTDLVPLITKTSLGIITETAMGLSMGAGKDSAMKNYFKAVHTVCGCVVKRFCRPWYIFDILYYMTKLAKAQKNVLKDLHDFTDHVIRERKVYLELENKNAVEFSDTDEVYGKRGRLALLDLLLWNEKNKQIDIKGIKEEVDTFMFEGHDTIAMALSFMIMRLANEPEIQEKIYSEMEKIFGNSQRLPTMDDFIEMKYLECCIKESLRLYPSVHLITRNTDEDTVLSGYTVPADTTILIHIFEMHHREDLYPDAEKFIPERFLPENSMKRHHYAYLPFSAGPRNCIGQKFAMLEMKTVVSGLLRRFKLQPVTKPDNITITTDLILRTYHPIYVQFSERH